MALLYDLAVGYYFSCVILLCGLQFIYKGIDDILNSHYLNYFAVFKAVKFKDFVR